MSDKKLKELDVKLHNFIVGQARLNVDIRNVLTAHKNILKMYLNEKIQESNTTVCVSAFM